METKQAYHVIMFSLDLILTKACENFTDSVETYLSARKIKLGPAEKLDIDKLFADAFKSSFLAEISALLSFIFYNELKNPEILTRIVPDFLDEYQNTWPSIPDELVKETQGLSKLAQMTLMTLKSGDEKNKTVKALCQDLANITEKKELRSSFDAILLSLLGQ